MSIIIYYLHVLFHFPLQRFRLCSNTRKFNLHKKGTFDDCGFWVNLTDIKGYTGSYAQTFAKNNNLKFISIGIGKVTNLKTTSRTNSSITLSWKKISGVSGYEIYRSTSKNKNYKKIATINNSKNTFKDSSLSKNKTYYYAKIYGNIYNGYRNKIFYKNKTNLIKSIKSSIKQYSGYWDDDNVASEIYNIMLQNNILNIGVLSI